MSQLLNVLQNAKLAEYVSGEWQATHNTIKISDQPGHNLALQQYHRLSLKRAIDAQKLPAEIRNYRAVSIALNPEEYKSYLSDLQEFANSILVKYGTDTLESRRFYQINFNIFPWTELKEF